MGDGDPLRARRGLGLAGKLLLAGSAVLVIPLLGYQALEATRDFLLQGQAQAQRLTAEAVANLFHGRSELFTPPADTVDDRTELPLYPLENRLLLDGLEEDWDVLVNRMQSYGNGTLRFSLVLGTREGRLYGLVKVADTSPVNRRPGQARLDGSDHIRLYFVDPAGQRRRLLLAFEGSGPVTAFETDKYWRAPLAESQGQAALLRGHVERDHEGYLLEFSLPLAWLGEQRQLGLAIADVRAAQDSRPAEIVATFATRPHSILNLLAERSAETDRILQSLAPADSRIWVIDSLGHVKAGRGPLEADTTDGQGAGWSGLLQALQQATGEWLLGIPRGPIEDFDPAITPLRQDPLVSQALAGEGVVERRKAVGGEGTIIAAAEPVYVDGDVVGAVLVEKSTRQVLGLQRQAIEQLAAFSALALALVVLALLGFAARLTYRIRRLDQEAEASIDAYGRLAGSGIVHDQRAADEIGDLARSFNRILAKLESHQQFLTMIPRTLRHEINNPLNTISTSLEQLEREGGENGQLHAANRALQRISLLVEKLCEAASLEEALQGESREPFDLKALVGDYCRNRSQRPPHPKLAVQLPGQPMVITGSDFHIEQLLDKLVDNAIDFALPGTTIEVTLEDQGSHCLLVVSNQGPAIARPGQAAIFQLMGSQREGADKEGHFGLGLYAARLISEFHGGSIRAANREGGTGASLQVVLPLER